MTDLAEKLRAQAVELRVLAEHMAGEIETFNRSYEPGGPTETCVNTVRSLADLIDGMLGERERLEQIPGRDFVTHMDNFVLPLLEFHVAAVLGVTP
jgi:hypothetical protein